MIKRRVIAAVLFVVSLFILVVKLTRPASISVIMEGASVTIQQLEGYFTPRDVAVIVLSALMTGGSCIYLFLMPENTSAEVTAVKKEKWTKNLSSIRDLGENAQRVYALLMENDGIMAQSDIVAKTGISKVSVTRALDTLEGKDLVERKRRGMGNIIYLR
jgi:DNA-binding transcriptional ArsR family regulator